MIYGQDRDRLRRLWCDAWGKARASEPLEPLEQLIAHTVAEHPEYHAVMEDPEGNTSRDWLPAGGETNPFLHLGMHLALQEALATDRPPGVREIYQALATRLRDAHIAEHRMMECLAEALWQAQRNGRPPDEQSYLNCLRRLLRK
ncbi:DUF1841 domain-containing protein [Gammaproteobacteria bacterium]